MVPQNARKSNWVQSSMESLQSSEEGSHSVPEMPRWGHQCLLQVQELAPERPESAERSSCCRRLGHIDSHAHGTSLASWVGGRGREPAGDAVASPAVCEGRRRALGGQGQCPARACHVAHSCNSMRKAGCTSGKDMGACKVLNPIFKVLSDFQN